MFRSYETDGRATLRLSQLHPLQEPGRRSELLSARRECLICINIDTKGQAQPTSRFNSDYELRQGPQSSTPSGQNIPIPLINDGLVDKTARTLTCRKATSSLSRPIPRPHRRWRMSRSAATRSTNRRTTLARNQFRTTPTTPATLSTKSRSQDATTPARLRRSAQGGVRRQPGRGLRSGEHQPSGPRNGEPNTLSIGTSHRSQWNCPSTVYQWRKSGHRSLDNCKSADTFHCGTTNPVWQQMSRLANPLINELVIAFRTRTISTTAILGRRSVFDLCRQSIVAGTAQCIVRKCARYPRLRAMTGGSVPDRREGLNQPPSPRPAELMRLNTSIAPTRPLAKGSRCTGGRPCGFPNGRRPLMMSSISSCALRRRSMRKDWELWNDDHRSERRCAVHGWCRSG